ncbi:MAG: hypothetical protein VR69_11995 [Peptococcaceae bacterium BRH_c4b]|nr:MAG: hypothetical protein VR69_11995 [Peptococcaceae bacterium BRH_c4b]
MKKITVFILCIVLVLMLSACGKERDTAKSDNQSPASQQNSATEGTATATGGSYKDFKTALSVFIADYVNTKKTLTDTIEKSPDKDKYAMDTLGMYTADLALVEVGLYDAISLDNGPRVTGKLALSGFDAYKEQSRDIIKFGSSHTFDKDQGGFKSGDKVYTTGSFDTARNFLTVEIITEKGGGKTARTVAEVCRLPDGTFTMQSIYCDTKIAKNIRSIVIMNFNPNKYTAVMAEGDKTLDFQYKSIADAGNISPEEMAREYKTNMIVKVENGNVTFAKK